METISETLITAREERGLSLADVHDATKISLQNLSALEEARFDFFPNKVYVRAFLRDYANFLNLDSAVLLEQYEEESGRAANADSQPNKRRIPATTAVLASLVLVAAAGSLYLAATHNPKPHHNATAMSSQVQTGVSEKEDDKPAKPSNTTSGATKADASVTADKSKPVKPETAVASTPQALKLRVSATQTAWVGVWVDGNKAADIMLSPGQTHEWDAKNSIRLRTGNAGGVSVKLNGTAQPVLGASGQIGDHTWTQPAPQKPQP